MVDLISMSFSQHNTYRRCKKAWAYDKVDGIKGIPGLAALRGTRYHEAIEACIKGDQKPNHQFIKNAFSVLEKLDGFDPEVLLEQTSDGVHVRGYADIIGGRNLLAGYGFAAEKTVIDWKFPGKSPGNKAKPDHISQVNLYGYLAKADKGVVAYPEFGKYFEFDIDHDAGERTFDLLVEAGKEIRDSGALEISGADQEPTKNFLCAKHCSYRAICPLGGS